MEVSEYDEAGDETQPQQETAQQILAERDDAYSPPVVANPVSLAVAYQAPIYPLVG